MATPVKSSASPKCAKSGHGDAAVGRNRCSQHFQRLAGQHRSLFAKAKRGAVQGTIDPNFDNDSDGADDISEADDDPEDDTASAHDGIGAAPTSGERRTNSGRSSATYDAGGANIMTHPPAAPIGSNSGSYDPNRRSASATRKIDTEAAERATLSAKQLKRYLSAKEWEEIGINLCRIGAVEVVVLGRLVGGRA